MNIALVLQHKLLLGIQRFMQGNTRPLQPTPAVRSSSVAATATRHCAKRAMPLRVLHEVEHGMPRSSTGRLVISGRMADVCAELDRLVEREAALH